LELFQKGKGDQCAEIRKLRLERELKRVWFLRWHCKVDNMSFRLSKSELLERNNGGLQNVLEKTN
jgi:hypothetical protein